jgi:hypothetical protein
MLMSGQISDLLNEDRLGGPVRENNSEAGNA